LYQALLTRRYLTSKIMPLLAAVAVMLCVAMVLIVWSVMTGFLHMLEQSGRTLIGDISITYQQTGFPSYEDLLERLRADPLVEAATPTIESYGLISLPYNTVNQTVLVRGIEPASFNAVTGFNGKLWWKPITPAEKSRKDREGKDPRLQRDGVLAQQIARAQREGEAFKAEGTDLPVTVLGTEVGPYNERTSEGYLDPVYFLPGRTATLTLMASSPTGTPIPDPVTRRFYIANQFKSGLYEIDANTIFVPLDVLQRALKMDASERAPKPRLVKGANGEETLAAPAAGESVRVPGRVTNIFIKGRVAPGARDVDLTALQARVGEIYDEFAAAHASDLVPPPARGGSLRVQTWREKNAMFIGAVEKERLLVLFIFGVVSLTAVFLVLAIFWAMVSEKTRDIGVLRAIGASRVGVAWLWLRYGLAIGVVGALLGGAAACVVVWNINPIHEWMGRALGIVVWDPKVYYFSEIPSEIQWRVALIMMVGGVVASVAGALVPAVKAAAMDPVRALRWE
jgi:lipoprotein-releasing system permease protein